MKSPFESKKEFTVPWIIVMMLFILMCVTACDYYEEGDSKASLAFEKMTVVEKGMYDVVEEEWGQSSLVSIRQAVLGREVKPLENSIPFIDIANVIKSNNDLTLKVKDNWTTDNKNKAIKSRWDRLDDKWYIKIISNLGLKENDIQKQKLIVDEIISDKPETKIGKLEFVDGSDYDIGTPTVVIKNEPEDSNDEIILLQDYDDLFYDLRGCDLAINKYDEIISTRLLTKGDREYLLQLATKCKAIKIGEKLRK